MFQLGDAVVLLLTVYCLVRANHRELVLHAEAEMYGPTPLNREIKKCSARICAAANAGETSDKVTTT